MKKELVFEQILNVDGKRLSSLIENNKTTINIYFKLDNGFLCCFFDVVRTNIDKDLLVVNTKSSDNFGLRLNDFGMSDEELENINLSIPISDETLGDFYYTFKSFLSMRFGFHNKFIVTYDDETMTAETVDFVIGDNKEHFILKNTDYTVNKETLDNIFAADVDNDVKFSANITNVEYFVNKNIRYIDFYGDKRFRCAYYIGLDNDKAIIEPCTNGNHKVFTLSVVDYGKTCLAMVELTMLLKALSFLSKRNGAISISFSKNEPKKILMRSAYDDIKVALSTLYKN